jgi:hypothetical protein
MDTRSGQELVFYCAQPTRRLLPCRLQGVTLVSAKLFVCLLDLFLVFQHCSPFQARLSLLDAILDCSNQLEYLVSWPRASTHVSTMFIVLRLTCLVVVLRARVSYPLADPCQAC